VAPAVNTPCLNFVADLLVRKGDRIDDDNRSASPLGVITAHGQVAMNAIRGLLLLFASGATAGGGQIMRDLAVYPEKIEGSA